MADAAGHIEWEVSVDSTICRLHQHAAEARKRGTTIRAGRVRTVWRASRTTTRSAARAGLTTKIHLAVDSSFQILAAAITAGQRGDAPLFPELRTRPAHVHPTGPTPPARSSSTCDGGRSRTPSREHRDQIEGTPPPPGFVGGRPPVFDREKYKLRNKAENRIGLSQQARGIATRYDKLAVRYEAAIRLALIRQAR